MKMVTLSQRSTPNCLPSSGTGRPLAAVDSSRLRLPSSPPTVTSSTSTDPPASLPSDPRRHTTAKRAPLSLPPGHKLPLAEMNNPHCLPSPALTISSTESLPVLIPASTGSSSPPVTPTQPVASPQRHLTQPAQPPPRTPPASPTAPPRQPSTLMLVAAKHLLPTRSATTRRSPRRRSPAAPAWQLPTVPASAPAVDPATAAAWPLPGKASPANDTGADAVAAIPTATATPAAAAPATMDDHPPNHAALHGDDIPEPSATPFDWADDEDLVCDSRSADAQFVVREHPHPTMPQDPTSSQRLGRRDFLINVRRLLMDAATMPALGEYRAQYIQDLQRVQVRTRTLRQAVDNFNLAVDDMIVHYTQRPLVFEYFHELCTQYQEQVVQAEGTVPLL
eukprot:jgi/Ulvmu1/8264/UM041_0075.1